MSKLQILQDARKMIQGGRYDHICNAVKCASTYWNYPTNQDQDLIKDGVEIIQHIESLLGVHFTFDMYWYENGVITEEESNWSHIKGTPAHDKTKTLRLQYIDELIEHFKNKVCE